MLLGSCWVSWRTLSLLVYISDRRAIFNVAILLSRGKYFYSNLYSLTHYVLVNLPPLVLFLLSLTFFFTPSLFSSYSPSFSHTLSVSDAEHCAEIFYYQSNCTLRSDKSSLGLNYTCVI